MTNLLEVHNVRRSFPRGGGEELLVLDDVNLTLKQGIGGVRGVYNRAEYEPQRREMLQFWADYIEQLLVSGRVVLGRFKQVA